MKKWFTVLAIMLSATGAQADTWSYPLPATAGKAALKVEVAPLKYGKAWAYAFEQDDNPASTATVSQPLLATYHWNDAPPGAARGAGVNHPFVGTAAVILGSVGAGNETALTYGQIGALQKNGWGIANHSYAHSGNGWEPSQALKPEDFKRELFWSQAVYAERIGAGRGALHFVLPNGYVDYAPYLSAHGLRSNSRVAGSSLRNVLDPKFNLLDLNRTYLDESVWKQSDNPLQDLPDTFRSGDFFIDFTHNIENDPNSANRKRWAARLDHIARTWGPEGDNSMWVAPTDEVVGYALAARAAKITVTPRAITVALPATVPGSALTLKISGLPAKAVLTAPRGGALYRIGATAYLTTPVIGKTGAPPLPGAPRVRCIYAGEVKNLTWEKPVLIAGVRIRQFGPGAPGFVLKLDALTPDDKTVSLLPGGDAPLREVWGGWNLYPVLPNRPAVRAKALRVTPGKDLNELEVWAVDEPPPVKRAGAKKTSR